MKCLVQFLDYEAQVLGNIKKKKLLKCEDCILFKQEKCRGNKDGKEKRDYS